MPRTPQRSPRSPASFFLGSLAAALVTLGCGPKLPRTPTLPGPADTGTGDESDGSTASDAGFVAHAPLLPGLDADPAQELQLEPGDVVTLHVLSQESTTYEDLVVDARGVLHVPLAGDVVVAGGGLTDAERRVEEALRAYDRAARASLVLTGPEGHRASVLGAVATPGRVFVTPGMRLADLLASAGGLARTEGDGLGPGSGDLEGARLVRDGATVPVRLSLALLGDPRHNVRIRAGDTLYVPSEVGQLVTVLGQARTPRAMVHRAGLRLTHALALAGGITRDGNWSDVRVVRGDAAHLRVYSTSVAEIVDGRASDVVLAPGDIVYVASAGHADVRDVMASITPLLSIPLTAASITVPALLLRN
jgi:polysaccharide export outer membrane protein